MQSGSKREGVTPGSFDAAQQLVHVITARVESGELALGERIPSVGALSEEFGVAQNTVSKAMQRLKSIGVLTGVAGGPTTVRVPPVHSLRHNVRYHEEKRAVLDRPAERASTAASEAQTGIAVGDLFEQRVDFDVVPADEDLAAVLQVDPGTLLLRRVYFRRHQRGAGASRMVSHLPYDLVADHPALRDPANEPWPGGTQHQLSTIGIELDHIDDHITASMPNTQEQKDYDIPPGVPVLRIRKVSYDTSGRAVEVADIPGPADRFELVFTTPLERWPDRADD